MRRFFLFLSCWLLLSSCAPIIARPINTTEAAPVAATNPGTRADCPTTQLSEPRFIPPAPYAESPGSDDVWYGNNHLWTMIPTNGEWSDLPHNPDGYTQKVFWLREGYFWTDEPEPNLVVTGRRVDADAAPLHVSKATNAFAPEIQSAMLVGVDFPTLGCWEITGVYSNTELSFVVWIAP